MIRQYEPGEMLILRTAGYTMRCFFVEYIEDFNAPNGIRALIKRTVTAPGDLGECLVHVENLHPFPTDYGDRQERADHLIRILRASPDHPYVDMRGQSWMPRELANEIEDGTEMGQTILAVGGFVIQALNTTPEFFKKEPAKPALTRLKSHVRGNRLQPADPQADIHTLLADRVVPRETKIPVCLPASLECHRSPCVEVHPGTDEPLDMDRRLNTMSRAV